MTQQRCLICRSARLRPQTQASEIAAEIHARNRFTHRRFDYRPSQAELMDLAAFMHGDNGALVRCAECGLTLREEDHGQHYENDTYDPDLLDVLYPRYRNAFRKKELKYRHLLPPKADVIELGSHLGAFLQVAEEWGWRPTGVDVGRDTSEFARKHGTRVLRGTLDTAKLPAHGADALFVWNCFEQLEDPAAALASAHRLLKKDGLLLVRTPNVAYYHRARAAGDIRALAYNNLLGFPYLAGYNPHLLSAFLRSCQFEPLVGFDSTLITVPYPDLSARFQKEIRKVRRPFADVPAKAPGDLEGPWIEVLCRRSERQLFL